MSINYNVIGMDSTTGAIVYPQTGDKAVNLFTGTGTSFMLDNQTTVPLSNYITTTALTAVLSSYATATSLTSGLATKQATIALGTTAQYIRGDLSLATFPTIPSAPTRTTSALTLSLVGTGATGTQISSTNDSSVKCTVSTSTTSTIGGPATSVVALKICATNNATEGSWTTVATFESDQNITLAIALQSVQIVKGQICADVPAGWYVKLVNSGTGTHSEAFVSGQQTIYG